MIVACETTETGWRAVTRTGEIIDIIGRPGEPPPRMPDGEVHWPDGSHDVLPPEQPGSVTLYRTFMLAAVERHQRNDYREALCKVEAAIALAPTTIARFHRSLILLAMGNWQDGLADYDFSTEPQPTHIPRWTGEDIRGKRLLLTHDHGFGDTIMALRYVPVIRAIGADVRLAMPPALAPLAAQLAPLGEDGDFYCPVIGLMHLLRQRPQNVPRESYLVADVARTRYWRRKIGNGRLKIGIAWYAANQVPHDYQRSIPLNELVDALTPHGDLVSIQKQGRGNANRHGVINFEITDFADCAALIAALDMIVSIDTAALHLAGAIGHPRVYGLLPHWHSWRWLAPWYPQVKLCCQDAPGDWSSALAKII